VPGERFHPAISENLEHQRRVVQIEEITRCELRILEEIRPHTRADCEPCGICQREMEWRRNGGEHHGVLCGHAEPVCHARPCPFVACRYHLASDITTKHRIVVVEDDLDGMVETCALDVADRGPITLEAVGALLHVTRERVRQLEERIESRLRRFDERLSPSTRDAMRRLEDYRE